MGSKVYTSTIAQDKRFVVDNGIGVSAGGNVTVNALDEGIVNKALDAVTAADALSNQAFEKLINVAGDFLSKSQETTLAQIGEVNAARADAAGSIDQKTMIVLGIVAAAALVLFRWKG